MPSQIKVFRHLHKSNNKVSTEEVPMGSTQWYNHGEKFGYWGYFQAIRADWNCRCKKPDPDGFWCVGEGEGRYQRCKNCDRRIEKLKS